MKEPPIFRKSPTNKCDWCIHSSQLQLLLPIILIFTMPFEFRHKYPNAEICEKVSSINNFDYILFYKLSITLSVFLKGKR